MSLPKDFDEAIATLTLRAQGLEKNKPDFSSASDQQIVKPFTEQFGKIKEINARQEQTKAVLHQISEELKGALKGMNTLDSQFVSLIYSKYTKKSDKLEDFGLKSWKTGGRKGPRAKKGQG
ncbi:MAG: hypothetical protein AB1393_13160 [Candidatus Edwardsbacteria bacterium]